MDVPKELGYGSLKLVSQDLIAKLKAYYKTNPRVIALVLTEPEWTSLCEWDNDCNKIRIEHGIKPPTLKSSHEGIGGLAMKDWCACSSNRWRNTHIWLAGKLFPKLPKCFGGIDAENYDHLIFIRLAKTIQRNCQPCRVKDICPNLLGYLTHEFTHIVEYEQGVKILPEAPEAYYAYVGELLKEIFKDELIIAEKAESTRR
jgi:hypothetical protein